MVQEAISINKNSKSVEVYSSIKKKRDKIWGWITSTRSTVEKIHDNPDLLFLEIIGHLPDEPQNKLYECSEASWKRLPVEIAKTGLSANKKFGYIWLIPRKNDKVAGCPLEVCADTGYKADTILTQSTDMIVDISGHIRYRKDVFKRHGSETVTNIGGKTVIEQRIEHEYYDTDDGSIDKENIPIGYYAKIVISKADVVRIRTLYMSFQEMEEHRIANVKSDGRPWASHYNKMALKTVRAHLARSIDIEPAVVVKDFKRPVSIGLEDNE